MRALACGSVLLCACFVAGSVLAQIVVSITGIDETFSQAIHARHTYEAADLRWNHRLGDILTRAEDGHRRIDYRHFHDTVEVDEPASRDASSRKVKA